MPALVPSLSLALVQVRLLLLSFASIRNAQGHARYVRWRNGRGE